MLPPSILRENFSTHATVRKHCQPSADNESNKNGKGGRNPAPYKSDSSFANSAFFAANLPDPFLLPT